MHLYRYGADRLVNLYSKSSGNHKRAQFHPAPCFEELIRAFRTHTLFPSRMQIAHFKEDHRPDGPRHLDYEGYIDKPFCLRAYLSLVQVAFESGGDILV